MEPHERPAGTTDTERILAEFCKRSFLKLWTYANPFKDDGKELCDVIAVFGGHVFVFFDREKQYADTPDVDPLLAWDRWKRRAVDRQVTTAHGAERYIRSGRRIFLDAKQSIPFPLDVYGATAIVHKIVVAHGAAEACKSSSEQNLYGSLAVSYSDVDAGVAPWPFHVQLERSKPVHLFDSHNFSIILRELDTITDLSRYLDEKVRSIERMDLSYCGEEDLLAYYLLNFDPAAQKCRIAPDEPLTGLHIGEGGWAQFVGSELYKNTRRVNEISYFWDELIQRTCQNKLDGTLGGNADLLRGQSAICEMVKEPRFSRRALSKQMQDCVVNFPDDPSGLMRHVSLMPSFFPDVGYVFFQLRVPVALRQQPDYLDKRRTLLEVACGAAKNKFPHLNKVIGIGIDAAKFAGDTNSEDFLLMPCVEWPDQRRAHYDALNRDWQFFATPHMTQDERTVTQFVPPPRA